MSYSGYRVDWVANFLHDFPHIDFKFEKINSTFNPESRNYKESIVFLAALPALWCILVLCMTSFCLCVQCCKQKPKKKRHTTCLRMITALFIIFSIASIAVGFFGNEESNHGVQSTLDALQDTNDTLTGSLDTLETLGQLTANINHTGINTLEKVFRDHLKEAIRKDVMGLAEDIRQQSLNVRNDINSIHGDVEKIQLGKIVELIDTAEFWRWVGTIILFSVELLVILIYILGTLKKSKYCLIWGITLGYVSLFLVWLAAGVYVGGAVGLGDFCVAPDAYIVNKLGTNAPKDVVESYIHCTDKRGPQSFSKNRKFLTNSLRTLIRGLHQEPSDLDLHCLVIAVVRITLALEDAISYVNKANLTLSQAVNKTLPYNISQYMDGPVRVLRNDLAYAQGNISSLSDTVYCGHIHSSYVKALTGLCNKSIVGVALILLILPVLGVSLIFVQCLTPRIWLLLGKRKGYRVVDDSDPFLPRPPPYNGYGAIGDDRNVHDASYIEDSTIMSDPPRPGSAASDSPPPAYYPGSFVEQYNNLGTFPRSSRPT